jgi:Putative beta-barrel porin-2, OmpL-like. bbp2/Carboxypeptidase regulatory-like domain
MNGLTAVGMIVLSGPLEGTPDVLLVMRADSAEAIRQRIDEDPWTNLELLRIQSIAPLDAAARRTLAAWLTVAIFSLLSTAGMRAQSVSSSLHGAVRTLAGAPASGATVVVRYVEGNVDRTVVAASDGTFGVANLTPGHYQLTASKDGFTNSSVTAVELASGQALDLTLTLGPPAQPGGFLKRLYRAYADDWSGTNAGGPEPPRRGLPSPLNSPPFPNSDWPYGGSPDIGAPDTNVPPLMQALYGGSDGKAWEDSRVKVYGWLEGSLNLSTSRDSNLPTAYDIYPNRVELDQAVLYIERLPDTVQTDHVDYGFHITGLFGSSYRFTLNKGYFSQQLLEQNRQYGFDPALEYFDLYIPQIADGLNIRIGRFISVPGIEAQLAPNNYVYTHSLLYSIDPFTDTGIIGTLKLNDRWLVQLGLTAGHDVAPWTSDAKPSATACLSYTFSHGNDNLYPCINGLNSGKYAYNNLQMFDATWYHKFNATWHAATEAWYMYERDVPNVAGPVPLEKGANGAFCLAGQLRCFAPEWAAQNYLEKQLSDKSYLSIRTDFLDDMKGQRTGFKTQYAEETLMWGHWVGSTILLRPEIRFDHSFQARAYDRGTRNSQFQFAMDVIFKF